MIDYVAVSEKTRNVIDYIVACVNEFSDAHDMDCVSGFDYLHTHNGVTFLERNYDVEHSYPIEDTVQSLASVCRHNGERPDERGRIAMTAEVKQLIEFATQDLVAEIVEKEDLPIQDAIDKLYHSRFFAQLSNPNLGLYRESGTYLYSAFLDACKQQTPQP